MSNRDVNVMGNAIKEKQGEYNMINNSLPMAGYNAMKEHKQTRHEKIAFCVWATAEINGVDVSKIEWELFENSTDEQLEKECEWLDGLLNK